MSETATENPQVVKVYKLRAELGDRKSSTDMSSKGKITDRFSHAFGFEFVDPLTNEEKEALLHDPSLHVYRRGVRKRDTLTFDPDVVTNTGGKLRRRTRAIARPEGVRSFSAFARRSEKTWVAVKFAEDPGHPDTPITPPKKLDLSKQT